VKHITVSPYFSRSNGLVEKMNQTIKSSLAKAKQSNHSLYNVISHLRSTPVGDGLPSPSVLLQSRNFRSTLFCVPEQLKHQCVDNDKVIEV